MQNCDRGYTPEGKDGIIGYIKSRILSELYFMDVWLSLAIAEGCCKINQPNESVRSGDNILLSVGDETMRLIQPQFQPVFTQKPIR